MSRILCSMTDKVLLINITLLLMNIIDVHNLNQVDNKCNYTSPPDNIKGCVEIFLC